MAVQNNREKVLDCLKGQTSLDDNAEAFTRFDLDFHILCTQLSGNPVFTLIFNGFGDLYKSTGFLYFSQADSRASSRKYYRSLTEAVEKDDLELVEQIVRNVMYQSIDLWKKVEA